MGIKFEGKNYKIVLVAILLAICCVLTYYFHRTLESDIVFTHFFYAPIILAALWWKRSGLAVAIFLAASLLFSHFLLSEATLTIANDYARAAMFIIIALVVAELSERITKGEKALQESKERLASFMNSAPSGFILFDSKLNCLEINRPVLEIAGLNKEEIIGKNITDLVPDIKERGMYDKYTKVIKTGKSFLRDDVLHDPVLGDIHLEVMAFKVGNGLGIIATDITERKRAEKDKEKTQAHLQNHLKREQRLRRELEKQDEARNQFVSLLAHELKSPLTAILPSAELMLDELNESSPLYALAQNLYSNASNLNARVSELLDFVRIQSSSFSLSLQFVDMEPLVRKVSAQMSPLLEAREQNLRLDFMDSLPQVEADPARVEQVLFNLLTNASKFSPKGTNILVRASRIDKYIQIDVEDVATPIKPGKKGLIFRPYYRDEQTSDIPGLGLGLSICKRLVELQGGHIWVKSHDNGNVFSFTLPLKARQIHIEESTQGLSLIDGGQNEGLID